MARAAGVISGRQERAERRKAQILSAARACVRAEGFHAASMSRIAAEAGMSVGHIYQNFENKEAIIIALSERDFDEFMLHITQQVQAANRNVDSIVDAFVRQLPLVIDHDQAALALEIEAEAGRNPKFQELVLRIDRRFREVIRLVIAPVLESLTETEIDVRVEMLLVMTRALGVHAGIHPVSDLQVIAAGFELVLRGLLSPTRHSAVGSDAKAARRRKSVA